MVWVWNGAEGVATQRQGRFAALGVSVLAAAMGIEMRQGSGVGGVIYKQWEYLVILSSKVYAPLV